MIQMKGSYFGASATTAEADGLSTVTTKKSVRTEKTEETDVSSTASIISSRTTPSPTPVTVAVVGEPKIKRDLGFLNKCECKLNYAIDIAEEFKKN